MGASLLAVVVVLFCGTGEDSLLAAEVRASALIGSEVGGAACLLRCACCSQVIICYSRSRAGQHLTLSRALAGFTEPGEIPSLESGRRFW